MNAGSPISMISEKGSRRICRISLTTTATRRLTAAPPGRRLPPASTWWMKTSSSEGRMRSIEDGGLPAAVSSSPMPRRPSAASATTTWMRVPKTEVSSAQGCAASASSASLTRGATTSRTVRPAKTLLQARDRAQGHEPPRVDEGEAPAVLGLVEVVRGDEDGHPVGRHLVDQPPEAPARDRVDPARGLVEEDDPRAVQDRAGEGQALLPAPGQLAGEPVLAALEARHVQRPGLALARGRAPQAVDPAEEAQVLEDGEVVVEAEALAHVADALLHLLRLLRRRRCRARGRCPRSASGGRRACGSWWTCPRRSRPGSRRSRPSRPRARRGPRP